MTNKCKSKAFQISMCSGDNNLTFEGGMGDFRTERLISGENNSCHKIPGKKIPALKKISFMAYYAGKKILAPLYVRKKFYHQRFVKIKILP